MTIAVLRDPDRVMLAVEHGAHSIRRIANFVPIVTRSLIESFFVGGQRGHQPGVFGNVCITGGSNLDIGWH